MVTIKPSNKFDGSEETLENQFYDGPTPTPGTYKGVVKKMDVTKYKSGERKGQPRIRVLLYIIEGKFKGAGIFHSLSYEDAVGAGWTNNFLDSLDGNTGEAREAFWHKGYSVGDDDGKGFRPIERFGKFRPGVNMECSFVTKMGEYNDEPQAKIARFVVKKKETEEEESESDLDGMEQFDSDATDLDSEDSEDPWE